MRKVLLAVLAVVILICTAGFSAGGASAAGIISYSDGRFVWGKGVVFVFDATGYRNRDVRHSRILVSSDLYDLYCSVDKSAGKIVCVASGGLTRFARQTGIIYLAGQIFYVTIPDRILFSNGNGFSCPSGTTRGANVTFLMNDESTFTTFVSGSTLSQVNKSAGKLLGEVAVSIQGTGNLFCGEESPS